MHRAALRGGFFLAMCPAWGASRVGRYVSDTPDVPGRGDRHPRYGWRRGAAMKGRAPGRNPDRRNSKGGFDEGSAQESQGPGHPFPVAGGSGGPVRGRDGRGVAAFPHRAGVPDPVPGADAMARLARGAGDHRSDDRLRPVPDACPPYADGFPPATGAVVRPRRYCAGGVLLPGASVLPGPRRAGDLAGDRRGRHPRGTAGLGAAVPFRRAEAAGVDPGRRTQRRPDQFLHAPSFRPPHLHRGGVRAGARPARAGARRPAGACGRGGPA